MLHLHSGFAFVPDFVCVIERRLSIMQQLAPLVKSISDFFWNNILLFLLFGTGIWFTVRMRFIQVRRFGHGLARLFGGFSLNGKKADHEGMSSFQALTTAIAAQVGTGNIAGCAVALASGGAGAIFWMWVSAFFGMATIYGEAVLAQTFRTTVDGQVTGGPIYYIRAVFKGKFGKFLAGFFSIAIVFALGFTGNMVQANSIATSLEHAFGWDRLAVGCVTAVLTGLVILGGIGRIGRVSEKLVPVMALLFLGGGVLVLARHAAAIPAALTEIVTQALTPKAALGGGMGYGMAAAMRYGVARGVFTNEAGLGSSAMAHAAADVDEPAEEGMWGLFEDFIATLLVCTVTALVILVSGVYAPQTALRAIQAGTVDSSMVGAALSEAAFATVMGRWGGPFVAVCLLMFAFSSLLGWSYYGERGLEYLTGTSRWTGVYRMAFLVCVVLGSVGDVGTVWQLADVCNGMMALPNLAALFLLSPEALRLIQAWTRRQKSAPDRA